MAKKITLPLTEELAKTLHAGDQVLLTVRSIPPVMQDIKECAKHWQEEKNPV